MDLARQNYIEQQLFQVAPLPLVEENYAAIDIQIRTVVPGRSSKPTNYLRITVEQLKAIEDILRAA